MDWSKAKTILIIALLIVCILLGSLLGIKEIERKKLDASTLEQTKKYLESLEIEYNKDIPLSRPLLPVLFVEYKGGETKTENPSYKGYPVCGGSETEMPCSIKEAGKKKARIMSASAALLQFIGDLHGDTDGLSIENISLIYYIDNSLYAESSGNDTAIPTWKIESSAGNYYINAYSQ